MNPTLSIIIPAYNEESRIEKTLKNISEFLRSHSVSFEIIVVANNCTDGTVALLERVKASYLPELVIIDIPRSGVVGNTKGSAIGVGMRSAQGLYHLFIDADNATTFAHVIDFMKSIDEGYGAVIGSRYIAGAEVVKKQPWPRVVLSRMGNLLIRSLLLPGIYDTQCGFKMFSRIASKDIFEQTRVSGWGADLEMIALARKFGYTVKEFPVRWEAQDDSRLSSNAFLSTLRELFTIRKNLKEGIYKKTKNGDFVK
jgi:dolichyl-phosphate beta-glucosyltransferase